MKTLFIVLFAALGGLITISLLIRLMQMIPSPKRRQMNKMRALAPVLGGRYRLTLIVADPILEFDLQGYSVRLEYMMGGRRSLPSTEIRVRGMDGPAQTVYVRARPEDAFDPQGLDADGVGAARALARVAGDEILIKSGRRGKEGVGFAALTLPECLVDRPDVQDAVQTLVHNLVTVAKSLARAEPR